MGELINTKDCSYNLKYTSSEVIYAMRDMGIADYLQSSCDLYKTDRQKWQNWYEKEVVVKKKLIPLTKAKQWLKENITAYISVEYKGHVDWETIILDKSFDEDFEKAMLKK